MDTVVRNFGEALGPSLTVAVLSVVVAVFVAVRGSDTTQVQRAGKVLAFGAVLTVVTATTFSWHGWGFGQHQVAFGIGDGGLGDWRRLVGFGGSHAARLWLLNLLIYVPVGLLVPIGFPQRTAVRTVGMAVLVAAGTSLAVETLQFVATERVAATDDWILNTVGGLIGATVWFVVSWARHIGKPPGMTVNRPSGFAPR